MDAWKQDALMRDEAAVLRLKSLYRQYGYTPFRMSRFEEYDFYADNRSFLQSENIITFTDLNGKLMALKPDVTLSIVKSAPEGGMQKVYYSENVYRAEAGKRERSFREIMQVGLECIGEIDLYGESEVLMLAARSLSGFSTEFALDISHMGLITGMLEGLPLAQSKREALLSAIGSRSVSAVRALLEGVEEQEKQALCTLASLYGSVEETMPVLRSLCKGAQCEAALDEIEGVYEALKEESFAKSIHFDPSIMNDIGYYNGLIFRGYVAGVPRSVLSGGRYDNLVHKMGKSAGAVGFAIYLDALDTLLYGDTDYDADVLLLYDAKTPPALLAREAARLTQSDLRVRVEREGAQDLHCRKRIAFCEGRAKELE